MKKTILIMTITLLAISGHSIAQAPNSILREYSEDSVKILSISPDTTESLNVGDVIEIAVEIEYEIDRLPATVSLIIQQGEIGENILNAFIASKTEVLNENRGIITLKQSIKVPNTNTIKVFTPVTPEGSTSTKTVAARYYKVSGFIEGETANDEE